MNLSLISHKSEIGAWIYKDEWRIKRKTYPEKPARHVLGFSRKTDQVVFLLYRVVLSFDWKRGIVFDLEGYLLGHDSKDRTAPTAQQRATYQVPLKAEVLIVSMGLPLP